MALPHKSKEKAAAAISSTRQGIVRDLFLHEACRNGARFSQVEQARRAGEDEDKGNNSDTANHHVSTRQLKVNESK
jgi:hypothetical protein